MKNTIFFFSLFAILYVLTSCEDDPVSPSDPDGYFISATIDGNRVEYIDGDGNLTTWPSTGGSLGVDTCWLGYGNGIVDYDIGSQELQEGLFVGVESEYIGPCFDEIDAFVNLFALGTREIKDEWKTASADIFYIDAAGVEWDSPDEASPNNMIEFTKRTHVENNPSFLKSTFDIEGTFNSWVYNEDGDSLRIEDGKFRLVFVAHY